MCYNLENQPECTMKEYFPRRKRAKIATIVAIICGLICAWAWQERVRIISVTSNIAWAAGSAFSIWVGVAVDSMNNNAGAYGVLIGLLGCAASWWSKSRLVKAAEDAAERGELTVKGADDE